MNHDCFRCAAAEFYVNGKMITLNLKEKLVKLDLPEQVDYLAELASKYPIISKMEWMKMTGMDGNAY
jgi:enolase